ncbi:MAG: hypothetical protein WCN98_11520 [Verrucomicrobiaceae bacterium]
MLVVIPAAALFGRSSPLVESFFIWIAVMVAAQAVAVGAFYLIERPAELRMRRTLAQRPIPTLSD